MIEKKQETVCSDYIFEREFLARISVTELIDRMIQSHISHTFEQEDGTA